MRRALIGFFMAATMVTPVAAQAQSGGFGSRVRDAIQEENREERRQPRTERRQERQEQRQIRRAERQQAAPRQDVRVQTREAHQERPRTWVGSVDRAIVREQREEALERQQRLERRAERRHWDRDWRYDRRYDWQRYRYYNRDRFNIGRYYSPYYGHGYSRFSIGFRLGSPFYSDRYWIRDPWQYRLPPAYAGTRWVRYYDDVLLVDLYSGEVVDVIYNFFW